MNKLFTMTVIGMSVLALAGCKAKTDSTSSTTKVETVDTSTMTDNVSAYTKADYMKACKQAMTDAQCECFVDFYGSVGLEVTELGNAEKVQAKMTNLTPEQMTKMSKCME